MHGVQNEGLNSVFTGFNRNNSPHRAGFQDEKTSGSMAPVGGDNVAIENLFSKFADKVKEMFLSEGGAVGAQEQSVVEFSVRASVRETFEGRYNYANSNTGSQASAYVQQTRDTNVEMSFRMEGANNVAQAQLNAMENPFGPEATANRIVDFALGFFPMFAKANPDMTHEEQVDAFQALVEGAIGEGFSEALQILGAIPGEMMDQLNETMDLVQEKLDSFFSHLKGEGADEGKQAAQDGQWRNFVDEFFEPETQEP